MYILKMEELKLEELVKKAKEDDEAFDELINSMKNKGDIPLIK